MHGKPVMTCFKNLFLGGFWWGLLWICSSTLDNPILGDLGRAIESRATLQQAGALSTGPCLMCYIRCTCITVWLRSHHITIPPPQQAAPLSVWQHNLQPFER
jgi:hypothetical protein